jgi:hypothetical protein
MSYKEHWDNKVDVFTLKEGYEIRYKEVHKGREYPVRGRIEAILPEQVPEGQEPSFVAGRVRTNTIFNGKRTQRDFKLTADMAVSRLRFTSAEQLPSRVKDHPGLVGRQIGVRVRVEVPGAGDPMWVADKNADRALVEEIELAFPFSDETQAGVACFAIEAKYPYCQASFDRIFAPHPLARAPKGVEL